MASLESVYSHSPNIVTRKTGNEYILVPVANNIADMNSVYTLNESGAFIWELIDGKRNAEEIISVPHVKTNTVITHEVNNLFFQLIRTHFNLRFLAFTAKF